MKLSSSILPSLIMILNILCFQHLAGYSQINTRACSFTGPVAQFCNVNVRDQLCVGGNLNVAGIISGQDGLGYGNTLIVDQVDGDDETAAVNGSRFKTIGAALAQASDNDLVVIYPGVYNEILTIPEGVTVTGAGINTVTIQQLDVATPTDLVTLGEGATLAFVDLLLTASADVELRGINHISPGGPDLAATTITYVRITLDNTGAGPTTSDIIGVAYTGISIPSIADLMGIVIINVNSNSSGSTRGVQALSDQYLTITTSSIFANGGTDSIGIETNSPSTSITCFGSEVGGTTADISQTAGTLGLGSTYLLNSTANDIGFTSLVYPESIIWADSDNPAGPGLTLYLRPGTGDASFIPIFIRAFQKFVGVEISVLVVAPPGLGESTTFTLQRKTPSDLTPMNTILSVTLSDEETSGDNNSVSVHFDQGDYISMQMASTAGAQTGDVIVSIAFH